MKLKEKLTDSLPQEYTQVSHHFLIPQKVAKMRTPLFLSFRWKLRIKQGCERNHLINKKLTLQYLN